MQGILQARVMIELVPDEYRNSVYSLIPTLLNILSIPFVALGGFCITTYGFSSGLLLIIFIDSIGVTFFGLGLYWLNKAEQSSEVIPLTVEKSEIREVSSAG